MAEKKYSAESLQVLSGLEPVRRRPGMYTDTTRPNHLVQEVVDNSVDEAIAGFAREIEVTLYKDGSVEVIDGRAAKLANQAASFGRLPRQSVSANRKSR